MKTLPIENRNAVKDMSSKAVLSTDHAALQAHKKQKQDKFKIDNLENRMNEVERQVGIMFDLIQKLANHA